MFNYDSVIEAGKEHLGMSSVPNSKNHREDGFTLVSQKDIMHWAIPSRKTVNIVMNKRYFGDEGEEDNCMHML